MKTMNHTSNTLLTLALSLMTCSAATGSSQPSGHSIIEHQTQGVAVHVNYLSDDIVHVVKYPATSDMPKHHSYSVILSQGKAEHPNVRVSIDSVTGCLTYCNREGELLLRETGTPMLEERTQGAAIGQLRIGQKWQLTEDEDIYGLGQLHDTAISWRGREMLLWNHNTYIAIPYVTSSKGYGLYWDNAGKSRFSDSAEGMQFTSEVSTCIDYYIIYHDGTQDGVMAAVRQLSGQATMMPLWTMGHWQCRERYKTSDELAAVLDRYRELEIPVDGIVQDWQYWGCDSNWNAMSFQNPYYINKVGDPQWERYLPDDLRQMAAEYKAQGKQPRLKSPEEMVEYVHRSNAHLMISIWASFGPWTRPYREMQKAGALLPFDTWPRNKGVMPYDPFNPKARDIYWKYLSHLYRMGFDAWWTDSTEPDHFNESDSTDCYMTHDGPWLSVKNAFPLMTNRGIYEHQRATRGNHKRSVQMTRSGTFGLQRYGTFSWSGDISASWKEMKSQVPSGLNYSLCGIPYWNTDLGGFFYWEYDNDPHNPALQELQTRWMQWGTYMPLMRNHCSSPMVSELYAFGKKGDWAYDAMVDAIRMRYRLLPYIYSMMGEVVQHSGTMMRPLVMDFANDVKARRLNDEYMFGHALLVKPVTDPLYTWRDEKKKGHLIYPDVKQASAPVSVYLPAGTQWYDFYTGQCHKGGRTVQRPTPISDMPVYVRAGSIIPIGPDVQFSSEQRWDSLTLRIYPGADGTFTLYEDEGDGYGYEQGQYSEIPFSWDNNSRTLNIGQRSGSFPGIILSRQFFITLPDGSSRTIRYEGKEISVHL
ncbi:MAG: glycoside hydrolase family 31 protein [Bacteroidales bacterium]|nr:glycoside hydrolase family 31 protein [Bacteroidales bacterium]